MTPFRNMDKRISEDARKGGVGTGRWGKKKMWQVRIYPFGKGEESRTGME